MTEYEKRKWTLVIIPFCVMLGTLTWSFFTNTPLIDLANNMLSVMALYYFFYHVYEFAVNNKIKEEKKANQTTHKKSV